MSSTEDPSLIGHFIGAAVAVFGISSICLLSPFIFDKYGKSNKINFNDYLPSLSNFAGGTLLALGLLHVLPESIENMSCSYIEINGMHMQYGYALCLFGVALMLLVEASVCTFGPHNFHGTEISAVNTKVQSNNSSYHGTNFPNSKLVLVDENEVKKNSSALITAVALFVHSIFDGVVIGQRSTSQEVWLVTSIILCHKVIASASLGVILYASSFKKTQKLFLALIFLISTPLGLLIFGFVPTDAITNGIFGCLSTGALIFVAFEMSFSHNHSYNFKTRINEFLAFFLGCLIVFGITLLDTAFAHQYHVHGGDCGGHSHGGHDHSGHDHSGHDHHH